MRRRILVFFLLVVSFSMMIHSEGLEKEFTSLWKLYVGNLPSIQSDIKLNPDFTKEEQFSILWEIYSQSLSSETKVSLEPFFRYKLLNDERVLSSSLLNCHLSKKLPPELSADILYYIFLDEEISEKSVIKNLLPLKEKRSSFFEELSNYGELTEKIKVKFATFVLRKMVEKNILRLGQSQIPLLYTETKRLQQNEFEVFKFRISPDYPIFKAEFNGDARNTKVISIFKDDSGKIKKVGVSSLKEQPLLVPAEKGTLFIFLYNSEEKESDDLISATFLKEFSSPVSIVSSELSSDFIKLTVEEEDGILGYQVVEVKESGEKESSDFVPSQKNGVVDYLFYFDIDIESHFHLKIYTSAGFYYTIPIDTEK